MELEQQMLGDLGRTGSSAEELVAVGTVGVAVGTEELGVAVGSTKAAEVGIRLVEAVCKHMGCQQQQ